MKIINVESIKMFGEFLGLKEGVGYIYKVGQTLYAYTSKDGLKELN